MKLTKSEPFYTFINSPNVTACLSANFILHESKRTLREFVIINLTAEPCTFKTDAGGVSRASKFEACGLWSRCRVWRLGSDNMLALLRLAVCFLTLHHDQTCSFRSPVPERLRSCSPRAALTHLTECVTDSGQCETLLWTLPDGITAPWTGSPKFKCGWEKLTVTNKTQMDFCLSILNLFFF